MPKLEEMAQLSRPFQIAFVAVCLLAAVWLFALRGHSTSTSGSGSTAVVSTSAPATSKPASSSSTPSGSASTAAAEAKSAAKPTHIYHGAAPGVEGLTRDINRAHHAVAESQQNAKALEEKSAQASGETAPAQTVSTTTPAAGASTATTAPSATAAPSTRATTPATAHVGSGAPKAASGVTVARDQREVEAELKQGKVAVLLFWNPKGTDDVLVHRQVQLLSKRAAVHDALASEVASYGSITRGVQIYATPTILVINKAGKTITLTGLQDVFSIEQAIDEARNS
jgi:cytoskeletal protein RodZ